ncbi:MAG: tRNA pseudouridine(13) synthase TruD [Pseudomonadales bacterium]
MVTELAYAYGGPLGNAIVKASVADFCVTEQLGFEPTGSGEHVFLQIQKRDLNTQDILDRLQRFANVNPRQLGYCGLKDKRAVTRQWFSVHLPTSSETNWRQLNDKQVKVLGATRHQRKLRIGVHKGNRFEIRLRSVGVDAERLQRRCELLAQRGFPNYFGPQRFGYDNSNLDAARRLFARKTSANKKPSRKQRLYISAARAYIFNALVAIRVDDDSWSRPHDGDVYQLNGSGSLFRDSVSDDIAARLESGDLHITGPLWGAGDLLSSGAIAAREQHIAEINADLSAGLAALGMGQQRRALRACAKNFHWESQGDDLLLKFELVKGSYATSLLRELVDTNVHQ